MLHQGTTRYPSYYHIFRAKKNKQVYTLEKVLKLKKDTGTGAIFLDEAMKVSLLVY